MMSAVGDEKRTRLEKKRLLRWELRTPGCKTRWHFDRLAKVGMSWGISRCLAGVILPRI